MYLPYILYITNYIISNVHGIAHTELFSSTIEAFVKDSKELCMGDCMGRKGIEECVFDWNGNTTQCAISTEADTPKYTKKYRTISNQVCYSNCAKFNENYEWCVIYVNNNVHNWNFCTRTLALEGIQTYRTNNEFLPCTDGCAKRGDAFYWCHTIKNWQECDPLKKIVVFNFLTESGKLCATPCELFNNEPYCYDKGGEWKKCYLNPDSSDELSKISAHMKATRAPGVYTSQGYRRCKSTYRRDSFTRPLSVEDIAKKYEESFPTVKATYLDPNKITVSDSQESTIDERLLRPDHLIWDETDPVKTYTVYNTLSLLSARHVNLPLVIRAVITNRTMQREFNNEIMNQINELYPIDDRVNYDETGHLIPTKLGGRTEVYNVFPQAWRHRRGALSGWWYLESALYTFINTHPNSYAEYTVVVTYNAMDFHRPYRPTAVGVRVRLYHGTRKQNDGSSQLCDLNGVPTTPSTNELENLYFLNDPDFNCVNDGAVEIDNFAAPS